MTTPRHTEITKRKADHQRQTIAAVLPTNRAFVVQLSAEAAVTPDRLNGRVEHVQSGQVSYFYSLDELLSFLNQVLVDVVPTPPSTGRKRMA